MAAYARFLIKLTTCKDDRPGSTSVWSCSQAERLSVVPDSLDAVQFDGKLRPASVR